MKLFERSNSLIAIVWLAVIIIAVLSKTTYAGPLFSEWGLPMALAEPVGGGCPMESPDGNMLYTASGRDGTLDIFIYERDGRALTFQGPMKVGAPVSLDNTQDFCPTPLKGGWLMFISNREGGCGGNDIYISKNNPAKGWSEPRNLGCAPDGPNTPGSELTPSLVTTSNGIYLYFSSNVNGSQDIYKSLMDLDGTFGPGVAVSELNTEAADQQPNVRRDGLEIVFASNWDNPDGNLDIWTATRESVDEAWSNFRNLSSDLSFPTVNGNETRPSLSWDGMRLYYRSRGTIYVSERNPGKVTR